MLFNSYIFILLFFPLCLAGYFGLNHFQLYNTAQAFLLAMSLWFYGFFNPSYLPIIITSILVNYVFTWLFSRSRSDSIRKLELLAAILFNTGILFYFKYFDFFLENINTVFRTGFPLRHILLPLGISFFTFQQISYVVDAYRGEVKQYNFLQYACFVTYFPQLIAGPIVTHDELIPQFADKCKKQFNWDNFAPGIYLFSLGLAKKVLLADTFGNAANFGFSHISDLNSTDAVLAMLAYTFQIYFDFSGYCDMAIGIGKTMNIDLPVNFDSPYKACSVTEFWKRWHKTLTRFFTRYIYIPLGGNRKGQFRTYCNVMIVFLVSGLWHGAAWTFVLWGFMHGAAMVFERFFAKSLSLIPRAVKWVSTFLFINFSWVFFRADTVQGGIDFLCRIFMFDFGSVCSEIPAAFAVSEFKTPLISLFPNHTAAIFTGLLCAFFLFAFALILFSKNAFEKACCFTANVRSFALSLILLVWCTLSFSGISTFLYFNF